MKPSVDSSSGKGIVLLRSKDTAEGSFIRKIFESQGKDYIVQDIIQPHPSFAALNDSSINTIRITTYLVSDIIRHAPLALRIGRKGKTVDNIHAGGLVIGVEDDGTLLTEAYELGYGDKTKKFTEHPDSHIIFSGYRLPGISKIIESAEKVHGHYPHVGIISWDYTVDEKGNPVLIEANIMGQSVWIVQMIHGKGIFGKDTSKILSRIVKN